MKKGQCRLCLETKDLLTKSHIIPKFLYKFLSGKNNQLVFLNNTSTEFRYNSEYEGNILCKNCDTQIIGKLDDYAARFICNKKTPSRLELINNIEYLIIENNSNYDYKKYKLFLLSLLWRSSISTRPFFKQIKLSNKIEEDLRNRILTSEPGGPEEYACFCFLPPLTYSSDGAKGFNTLHMPTMSPMIARNNDWEICKFIIEGMTFFFLISKPNTVNKIEPSVETNKLSFRISTPEEQNELINIAFKMLQNQKKINPDREI